MLSNFVIEVTIPPPEETRKIELASFAKMMLSSAPHEPPNGSATSASTCTGPAVIGTFFSFPSAKKPTQRLSGDQNGSCARSVPGSGRAATCSMERSQSIGSAPGELATNTMALPSGGEANCGTPTVKLGAPEKTVFSGGLIENRTGPPVCGAWRWLTARNDDAHRNASASIQATRSRHGLCLTTERTVPSPSEIHFRFVLRSRADCQRSSGSFSRQVLTTLSSARGNIGRTAEIGAGFRSRIAAITLVVLFPSNARLPVAISYSTAPKAKMSLLASASFPSICSGDMY